MGLEEIKIYWEKLKLEDEVVLNKGWIQVVDSLIQQAEKVERYEKALKEIMRVNEKHEWNLYGLAYAIAEKALLD